jgi:hypothetical protein
VLSVAAGETTVHDAFDTILFWGAAIALVVVTTVGVSEWLRVRQYKENLKANGRRK